MSLVKYSLQDQFIAKNIKVFLLAFFPMLTLVILILLISNSKELRRTEQIHFKNLRKRAMSLVIKDGNIFRPIFEENGFAQINQVLNDAVLNDDEIIRAQFFTVNDDDILAWTLVDGFRDLKLVNPITYKNKYWVSKSNPEIGGMYDPYVPEIIKSLEVNVSLRTQDVIEKEITNEKRVFEATIPVFSGKGKADLLRVKGRREAIGFLRYTFSLKQFDEIVEAMKTESRQTLYMVIFFLIVAGLCILIISYKLTLRSAKTIVEPITELTHISIAMAKGNYRHKINVQSEDEIGVLANSFQVLCEAISYRDKTLEEINASLEKTVFERTEQLNIEISHVKLLLDNMKQAVFTINTLGTIVPPVSNYSSEVFHNEIVGKSIFEILYLEDNLGREMIAKIRSALICVFNEGEFQWDLMEEQFPRRIQLKGDANGNELQILQVSVIPIFDKLNLVSKIMFTVEDITQIENLMSRIQTQNIDTDKKIARLVDIEQTDLVSMNHFINTAVCSLDTTQDKIDGLFIDNSLGQIMKVFHLMKGNARSLGLSSLSLVIHECEEGLEKIISNKNSDGLDAKIGYLVDTIKVEILAYCNLLESYFGVKNRMRSHGVDQLLKDISKLEKQCVIQQNSMVVKFEKSAIRTVRNLFRVSSVLGFDKLSKKLEKYLTMNVSEISIEEYGEVIYMAHEALLSNNAGYFLELERSNWKQFFISEFGKNKESESDLRPAIGFLGVGFMDFLSSQVGVSKSKRNKIVQDLFLLICSLYGFRDRFLKDKEREFDSSIVSDLKSRGLVHSSFNIESIKFSRHRFIVQDNNQLQIIINEILRVVVLNGKTPQGEHPISVLAYEIFQLVVDEGYPLVQVKLEIISIVKSFVESPDFLNLTDINNRIAIQPSRLNKLNQDLFNLKGRLEIQEFEKLEQGIEELTGLSLKYNLAKLENMVNELSSNMGKKISFYISGDYFLLPESMVWKLQEALIPIIRNGIDHGIEYSSDRKISGKSANGKIQISIFQDLNEILVEVSDDGKGMDFLKLRENYIQKCFHESNLAVDFSKLSIEDIVFHQGFSSKQEATEISGRGVGLSISKEIIESMGGSISIYTERGKGASFCLRVPRKRGG